MAKSKFLISVTREDGQTVHLRPGGRGERDLVETVVNALMQKPIGVFRTKATVRQHVEDVLNDALHNLKSEVLPS